MNKFPFLAALLALSFATGCEEKSENKLSLGGNTVEGCDLALDNVADTEWLYLRANPDKTEVPDETIRMKFVSEDGQTKAKYNVGSITAMYTYNCTATEKELICKEKPKVSDWCQALVAGGGDCTPETLRKIDSTITDEQVKKGMEEGLATIKKYKDTPDWDKFVFSNNNLGNKLQGLLYINIDKKNCRIRVTDNYVTIYNAKKIEDSNPAGTNPFVKNDMGDLLWEHCTNSQDLVPLPDAEYPKDPGKVQSVVRYKVGDTVNFWYLGEDGIEAKEGCSESADYWLKAKPLKSGVVPETVEVRKGKELRWHLANTFSEPIPAPPGGTISMVRTTTCEGKEPVTATYCTVIAVE